MDEYSRQRQDCQAHRIDRSRRQMLTDQDLCLKQLLPQEQIEAALQRHPVCFRQCLYTPLVTIWTFLYQVLAADQSCRAAVAHLLAFLCVGGDGSGSAKTDPYCKARQRLPEDLLEHGSGNVRGTNGPDLRDDEWHHVAATIPSGAAMRDVTLYVDGSNVTPPGTTTATFNLQPDVDVRIGMGGPTGDRFLTGLVDDARIYDRVLSVGEIAWLAGKTQPFDESF